EAPGLTVTTNRLADNAQGVRASGCPDLTVEGNHLERQWSQIRVRASARVHVTDNLLLPDADGRSSIYLIESPDALLSANGTRGGGTLELYQGCDGAVVERNTFAGDAHIAMFLGSHYRIVGNELGWDGKPDTGGAILLLGTTDSTVSSNR